MSSEFSEQNSQEVPHDTFGEGPDDSPSILNELHNLREISSSEELRNWALLHNIIHLALKDL